MNLESFEAVAERLIAISIAKPLLPELFVPWATPLEDHHRLMPETLLSLQGDPLFDTLTERQKRELATAEIVQVMYSYAWSETLACLFFNRHLLDLQPTSAEYRFLLRELIEEFRHQEMFSKAISQLGGNALPPRWLHRVIGTITAKYLPADLLFMSVLGIELVTDAYGKALRESSEVYPVLSKISELHNIEEGRHIHYTELWLKRFTDNAGWFRRSAYSVVVCLNIYFMRTLYVRKEIFERLGVSNPERYAHAAYQGLRKKFAVYGLGRATQFIQSFNGFNWLTKAVWKQLLNAPL
jgi:hypothetical protein